MSVKAPEFLEVPAKGKETATVIFLHGSGGGWEDMAHLGRFIQEQADMDHIRWVLPIAPHRNWSLSPGIQIPAWFDVRNFPDLNKDIDEEGIRESMAAIEQLLEDELARGVNPESRIVLGGLSQGGAMSLLTGLTISKKLAGLIVLSGRLPLQDKLKDMLSPHSRTMNIFWGTIDTTVPLSLGKQGVSFLQTEVGIPPAQFDGFQLQEYYPGLTFKMYPGLPHRYDDGELIDVSRWLKFVLPPKLD